MALNESDSEESYGAYHDKLNAKMRGDDEFAEQFQQSLIQSIKQSSRSTRRRSRVRRLICPGCEASLTSADHEAGQCTQCGYEL